MTEANQAGVENIMVDEKNIIVNLEAEDRVAVILKLGGLLFENGYVKDSYTQAVLDREEVFPTGLQTTHLGMAVPHTDTEHVLRSAIAVATLAQPVLFQGMGSPDTSIPVTLVMMLAIQDPKAVIPVLRSVLFILEKTETLRAIVQAKTELEIQKIVQKHIQDMASLISSEAAGEFPH